MNKWTLAALILTIIGGLNWGLVGLFDFNLVGFLFGEISYVSRIIYIIVGISAVWLLIGSYQNYKTITK